MPPLPFLLSLFLSPAVGFSPAAPAAAVLVVFILKERVKQVSEDNGRLKLHVRFAVAGRVRLSGDLVFVSFLD